MNPKTIAGAFKDGHTSPSEAMISFVYCAMDNGIADIVSEIPEALRDRFKAFINNLPEANEPTLTGPTLKKEWILGFKSYYKNRSS